jgi:hypothetical protein
MWELSIIYNKRDYERVKHRKIKVKGRVLYIWRGKEEGLTRED